jgi:hypothetical protein
VKSTARQASKEFLRTSSRPSLTELYRRAGYLITLTYAPSWDEKFGTDANTLRRIGREEFQKTAKKINSRAKKLEPKPIMMRNGENKL